MMQEQFEKRFVMFNSILQGLYVVENPRCTFPRPFGDDPMIGSFSYKFQLFRRNHPRGEGSTSRSWRRIGSRSPPRQAFAAPGDNGHPASSQNKFFALGAADIEDWRV